MQSGLCTSSTFELFHERAFSLFSNINWMWCPRTSWEAAQGHEVAWTDLASCLVEAVAPWPWAFSLGLPLLTEVDKKLDFGGLFQLQCYIIPVLWNSQQFHFVLFLSKERSVVSGSLVWLREHGYTAVWKIPPVLSSDICHDDDDDDDGKAPLHLHRTCTLLPIWLSNKSTVNLVGNIRT